MPCDGAVAARISIAGLAGLAALLGAALLPAGAGQAPAGPRSLVGTWRLVSHQRADANQPPAQVPNPVGILIQDARGNFIEIVTRAGRPAPMNAAEQFISYKAFWGSYSADAERASVTYKILGDLDPSRTGQQVVRSYARNGEQLVLTESAPEIRTAWERVAELEALPDYQRDVVGFWQWVSAGLFDASGANLRPAARDASVIVYAPTGLMAVLYLPPPGRKAIAGATPSVEEARALMQGAPTYFGPYMVHPKSRSVIHYQLATPNPGSTGSSLRRNFEVNGSELVLRFPPAMLNGRQVRNVLHLKRLSSLADMWPGGGR